MLAFAHPELLYLLYVLPVLYGLYLFARLRRRRRKETFAGRAMWPILSPSESPWRPWVQEGVLLLGAACLIVALARPRMGIERETREVKGIEIMVALDVSRSMLAEDVKPSRLARAKLELRRLIERMENHSIGLVVFAGESYVQLPITRDYTAAMLFVESIDPSMITAQGTAVGDAIALAAKCFSTNEEAGKALLVITDGENHTNDPIPIAEEIASRGINIYTVGYGTPSGGPIKINGTLLKDTDGSIVMSKLDEGLLVRLAQVGHGEYTNASSTGNAFEAFTKGISQLATGESQQEVFSRYVERYTEFALAALLLILIATVMLPRRNAWFDTRRLYERIRGSRTEKTQHA